MSKICVDARMYNHSGIGKYLQMLLPGICDRFEVTLLGDPDTLAPVSHLATVVPFKAPIYSISEQRLYRKLIGLTDIFWSPHFNAPLTRIKSAKRIVTIHDVYHLAFYDELSYKQRLYAKIVINNAVKNNDAIITVSHFSKNEIIKYTGCDPNKIHVIYNGVEKRSGLNEHITTGLTSRLPANYILFVGNVKPHKNLKTLLKAYLLLNNALKSIYKVVIVGKKEGFISGDSELIEWVNNTDDLRTNVFFTGYIDNAEISAVYSNAGILVFPSLYEGFGLPPLEAMSNGCPVIASNAGSIPEICGDAADYFPPFEAEELSIKINALLTNQPKRDQLIAKGIERMKLFSWESSVKKHACLFDQLLH